MISDEGEMLISLFSENEWIYLCNSSGKYSTHLSVQQTNKVLRSPTHKWLVSGSTWEYCNANEWTYFCHNKETLSGSVF